MQNTLLRHLYIPLVTVLLGISQQVFSEQTRSGMFDLIAPEIKHVSVPSEVYIGSSIVFKVKAVDDAGVKSVALYYRLPTYAGRYKKLAMEHDQKIDEYQATIDEVSGMKIDYYIEAVDLSGNVVMHGSSFSPMIIDVKSSLEPGTITGKKDGVLTEKEILSLFSNRTVNGYHEKRNFKFVRFFAADGKLYGNNPLKGKRSGRWDVTSKGLCFHWKGGRKHCRKIVIEKGIVRQYKVTGSGGQVLATTYSRFRDGNPEEF